VIFFDRAFSPSPGTPGEGWGGGCGERSSTARAPSLTLPRSTGGGNRRAYLLLIHVAFVALCGSLTFAQVPPPPAPGDAKPSILEKVGIDQKLGDSVPGDLLFKDEDGHVVRLQQYLGKRPTVLVLAYFQCPMLCTMVLNDLLRTVRAMRENVGTDFDIITVSFDPSDTPRLARRSAAYRPAGPPPTMSTSKSGMSADIIKADLRVLKLCGRELPRCRAR